MSYIPPGTTEARYYAHVGVLFKVVGSKQKRTPEALRNGGLLTPVASSKIEPGSVKARGKSGTSLHFFANLAARPMASPRF
jgi:hypothetical protein